MGCAGKPFRNQNMSTTIDHVESVRAAALQKILPKHPERLSVMVYCDQSGARWTISYLTNIDDGCRSISGTADTPELAAGICALNYRRWLRWDAIRREVEQRMEDIAE
jgi:hypothetical protein